MQHGLKLLFVLFKSYYHFSPSMPLFQMPDSVGDLTQPVTPVDDRGYLSVAMSSLMDGEVLFARSRN